MLSATASQSLIACWTTRLESSWIERRVAPQAFAMRMRWSSASYFASLFEVLLKLIWSTYLSLAPLGEISTMPAPLGYPSKNMVHEGDRSVGPGVCTSVH